MATVTPFLWYDDDLQEAMEFYTSIFPDSEILQASTDGGGTLVGTFRIGSTTLSGMSAGPHFPHTEAFSLMVTCDGQEEVDRYWEALLQGGGEESQCGWLKDRFGLSWQVVPTRLLELTNDPDPERARRAQAEMLTQRKIDLAAIERAADG